MAAHQIHADATFTMILRTQSQNTNAKLHDDGAAFAPAAPHPASPEQRAPDRFRLDHRLTASSSSSGVRELRQHPCAGHAQGTEPGDNTTDPTKDPGAI